MPGPCEGLTVLDFSLGMPGALCTLVLADYGAEVIKVEPSGGDPYRFQPAWISWNRGKKGVVLDLSTSEGREQAILLAGEADVLVESFRPSGPSLACVKLFQQPENGSITCARLN